MTSPYDIDLDKNPANHVALSPLGFLERAAAVYPKRLSVVHGKTRHSWAETHARCRRLCSALKRRGIGKRFSSVFYWAATVSDSQSVRFISKLVFEATTCGEL